MGRPLIYGRRERKSGGWTLGGCSVRVWSGGEGGGGGGEMVVVMIVGSRRDGGGRRERK